MSNQITDLIYSHRMRIDEYRKHINLLQYRLDKARVARRALNADENRLVMRHAHTLDKKISHLEFLISIFTDMISRHGRRIETLQQQMAHTR